MTRHVRLRGSSSPSGGSRHRPPAIIRVMFGEEGHDESFEETLRSIARELGQSVERAAENVDLDEIADAIGVDPASAKEWIDSAGSWLRAQAETFGEDLASRVGRTERKPTTEDPLRNAQPHPLDLPTDEQGLALAALDSGRWTVEPGTNALAARGEGPGPSDALGLVRELHTRDWISAEGETTLVGRHALSRWLDATSPR